MSGTKRSFTLLLACISLAAALPFAAEAQLSVEGAWTVSEWTIDDETSPAQPGIFIFTSTHYSVFFVNPGEERASPAQGLTDAEKVVAYDEFTANAGRYTLEGNTLTTRAYLAKNPGYMAAWPDNTNEITVERDGDTLSLTYGNGFKGTLIRREGQTPPG